MSRLRRIGYSFTVLTAATLLVASAGCGSGAIEGPDQAGGAGGTASAGSDGGTETVDGRGNSTPGNGGGNGGGGNGGGGNGGGNSGGGNGGGGNGGGGEEREEYRWSLPGGDLSLNAIGDVFNSLVAGDCEEARSDLEVFLVNDNVWTARQETLYRTAIAVCSGDLDAGRALLGGAGLTSHPGDCRLYKAIRSVLDQRPQDSVACPAPEARATSTGTDSETTDAGGETTDPGTPTEEPSGESTTSSTETRSPATDDAGATSTGDVGTDVSD